MNESKEHDWLRPTDEKYDFRTCTKCGKRTAFYMHEKSECPGKMETMSGLGDTGMLKQIQKIIRKNITVKRTGNGIFKVTANEADSSEQILAAIIAHLEKCPAPRATEEDACYFMKQEMIKSLKEE